MDNNCLHARRVNDCLCLSVNGWEESIKSLGWTNCLCADFSQESILLLALFALLRVVVNSSPKSETLFKGICVLERWAMP